MSGAAVPDCAGCAPRGGPLRQGADGEAAIGGVWFHNDPAHYGALVLERGWPEE